MDKQQKQELVEVLKGHFEEAGSVVVTHYTGLTVSEMTELRADARKVGARFLVTKNSLAKLALQGTDYNVLAEEFTGPTAIAFSKDPVAAAKVVVEFSKKNDKLIILSGSIADQKIDATGIKSLAKLPSLDELRGKLLALINTPATRIAGILQAPAGQVARVVNAYSQKNDE